MLTRATRQKRVIATRGATEAELAAEAPHLRDMGITGADMRSILSGATFAIEVMCSWRS
jgi:hypothetical protein